MSCLGAVAPRPHATVSAGEAGLVWLSWLMKIDTFQLHFSMILLAVPVADQKMAPECLEMSSSLLHIVTHSFVSLDKGYSGKKK